MAKSVPSSSLLEHTVVAGLGLIEDPCVSRGVLDIVLDLAGQLVVLRGEAAEGRVLIEPIGRDALDSLTACGRAIHLHEMNERCSGSLRYKPGASLWVLRPQFSFQPMLISILKERGCLRDEIQGGNSRVILVLRGANEALGEYALYALKESRALAERKYALGKSSALTKDNWRAAQRFAHDAVFLDEQKADEERFAMLMVAYEQNDELRAAEGLRERVSSKGSAFAARFNREVDKIKASFPRVSP